MKKVVAMILAGGHGSRMDILCHRRPKPALPFAGKLRVIDFSLSNCLHSEITNIAALVDYQRHYLSDYLQQWHLTNNSIDNFHILEPKTGSYSGTADAFYQNLDYIKKYNPDAVLVLAGDHVYRMDYRKMLAFHHQVDADVTIGAIPVPIEEARRFGIVTTKPDGNLTGFIEKPKIPTNNLASMGIYVFQKQVLIDRLIEDNILANSQHDFGRSIIPEIVKDKKVFAYKFDGYWQDIGTVAAYYKANMELLSDIPSLSLNGKWPIFSTNNFLLPPRIIHQDRINRSLVGQGCIIRGKVENSILSDGVMVDENAVVTNSVVMANTTIGKHSVVNSCILDEDVNVGEFCYVGFGATLIPGDRDITVIGKGVAVPSGTAIGRNCKVQPEVRLEDFGSNVVPAGSIVARS